MSRRRRATLDPHLRLRVRRHCDTRLSCDLQGLRLPEFAAGVEWGAAGLVAGLAIVAWHRRNHGHRQLPLGGLLMVAATLGAFAQTGHLFAGLAVAVVALVVGGLLADYLVVAVGQPNGAAAVVALRAGLAVPGAWLLAERAGLAGIDPAWVRLTVGVVTVAAGVAVADLDRRSAERGLGPMLMAITAVGLYETVPDTDLALVLLGAIGVVALAAFPWPLMSLGGGASAVVGLLAWVAAVGGRGRLSAVVGGVACLGLLVAEPAGRLLAGGGPGATDRLPARRRWVVAVAGAQAVVVVVASRLAGARHDLAGAIAVASGALGAAAVLAAVIAGLVGRRVRAADRVATQNEGRQ